MKPVKTLITPLEIYKVLEQSNCKRCALPGCLAFAVAVIGGQKRLNDCPHLSSEEKEALSANLKKRSSNEPAQAAFIDKLLEKVSALDMAAVASERGAFYKNETLSIVSLGKEFHVERSGQMKSSCHIIPWVQAPILSYLCNQQHKQITGRWVSFREIPGGIDWRGLFRSRCETPLKVLADNNTELLSDIVDLFLGKEAEGFDADIAVVLHPLPHIPISICYQAAEDDIESDLNIFFDECCSTNLHVKSLYTLCAGLVKMFEQITKHHY